MSGWGYGNMITDQGGNRVNQSNIVELETIVLQQKDQQSLTIEAENNILPYI